MKNHGTPKSSHIHNPHSESVIVAIAKHLIISRSLRFVRFFEKLSKNRVGLSWISPGSVSTVEPEMWNCYISSPVSAIFETGERFASCERFPERSRGSASCGRRRWNKTCIWFGPFAGENVQKRGWCWRTVATVEEEIGENKIY